MLRSPVDLLLTHFVSHSDNTLPLANVGIDPFEFGARVVFVVGYVRACKPVAWFRHRKSIRGERCARAVQIAEADRAGSGHRRLDGSTSASEPIRAPLRPSTAIRQTLVWCTSSS
jgi:hypothetical protein